MTTEPTSSSDPDGTRLPAGARLRMLELFCGIGGAAAALSKQVTVAWAVDTNQQATAVYAHNFDHPVSTRLIEAIPIAELDSVAADLWWMSPPCQPYTVRGLRGDLDDRRVRPFLHVVDAISQVRPRYVALENVPGFQGSRGHGHLTETLTRAGYEIREQILCPTSLGWRNQRRRFYLVAGREGIGSAPHQRARSLAPPTATPATPPIEASVGDLLDRNPDPSLDLEGEVLKRYPFALDRVDPDHPDGRLACFTSAYGRSPVRSGSYVITATGLRRLSPHEILRALGFPKTFTLPDDLPRKQAWRLVGNSLSVPAVRHALRAIPELAGDGLAQSV